MLKDFGRLPLEMDVGKLMENMKRKELLEKERRERMSVDVKPKEFNLLSILIDSLKENDSKEKVELLRKLFFIVKKKFESKRDILLNITFTNNNMNEEVKAKVFS